MNAPAKLVPTVRSDPRPASAVSTMVGIAGLAGLLAWTAAARLYGMEGPLAALVALVACALPMLAWSLLVDKVHRNPTTGIDWSRPPVDIHRLVRVGGAWTTHGGKRLKVWRTHLGPDDELVLDEVQPEGKGRMSFAAWANAIRRRR